MSTGSSIDSGTGTPANGRGASSAAVAVAGSSTPVRWIVLFTGRTATDDYQPSATVGEKPALVKEVTDVCVAFHPHSDIRLFPASGEALLFYKAKSTGEWVITRVATAPNPDGVRTALEYCSVVLGADDFKRLLNGNPFNASGSGALMDSVREHFLSGAKTPVSATVAAPAPVRVKSAGSGEPAPPFNGEASATPENTLSLQDYFAARGPSAASPPTFASWWSSGGHLPGGYFDIVLRAPVARAVSLRDASDSAAQLASDVKSAMPRIRGDDAIAGDLARSILASADAAHQAVSHAASHLNSETPAQFQAQLTEAARLASQLASDIASLISRLGSNLTPTELARLNDMSQRGEELVRDLPRVRHPNPFARRTGTPDSNGAGSSAAAAAAAGDAPSATVSSGASASNGRNTMLIGGGAVAALAIIFGAWGILGHRGHSTSDGTSPSPGSNPTAGITPGGPAPAPPSASPKDPASIKKGILSGALSSSGGSIESGAKDYASKAAAVAVKGSKGGSLPETQVDKIAALAMTSAFKTALTSDQWQQVFSDGTWSYAQYKRAFPDLALGVHEAAAVAVTQDVDGVKIKKVEAAKPTPEPATPRPVHHRPVDESPTPEPTRRPRRPTGEGGDNGTGGAKHKPSPSSTAPAKPKAGTADQTGL